MKIRTMLIISMIVFSVLSSLLFTVFVGVHLSSSSDSHYRQTMRELSGKQSHAVESYFDSYIRRFDSIAGNPAVIDFVNYLDLDDGGEYDDNNDNDDESEEDSPEYIRVRSALEALTSNESGITGITIFDERNDIFIYTGSNRRNFLQTRVNNLSEHQFTAFPIQSDNEAEQNFELLHYARIGSSPYFMLCSYSSDDIVTFFYNSRPSTRGKIVLICPLNNILDVTFRGNLDEGSRTTQEYIRINSYIRKDRDEQYRNGTTFFTYELGRENSIALFDRISDTGWLLGVIGKTSDINDYSVDSIAVLRNLAIFLGVVMVALSVLFAIWFTKPLVIIKDVLTKVRRGDHEVRISISQGNEFGKIAKEFNDLLDNVVIGEGRHKTVIEMSDNIIFEWNFLKDEVHFSNNFSKKFSYRAPTDSYKDSFLVKCKIHPEDTVNYKKTLEKLSKGESIQQDEFRWKNIFGDYVWFLLRACAIRGANNEILKVVGVIVDIDNAKKKEKILSARANYDALTGLYNRETLEELINNEIDLITARKNEFAILFIDVDDFKFFNDNYSHATGDQVLRFTALSINDIVSNYGMAGRFGGDEFVVCIRNSEINDPAKTAEEILTKLGEGFMCDVGDQLSVKVSIGIAIIRDTAKRVDEIIGMADEAMYKIKKSGKSNYGFIN
ncbi:MAG: diguanylate cyclase [Oscillospiraceae bacterium]|jgi:diguanylate cyclase (GGDEF)-like protein|nr:diguanylate cyclase [Oscillospiraceae bacterium]